MTKLSSLNFYKQLFLIRSAEEKIVAEYQFDEMKTPMHMSMGEEAIVVGVTQALGSNSQTFGTYRSHALFLAVTQNTDQFFSEMYGRKAGAVKGKGGSMHLSCPEKGLMATSAVVASTIPVAVGSAYSNKYLKNGKIVAVFFGDGAVDEGVFWESLNIACLMRLPIIFICEDNGFAVHSKTVKRRGYKSLMNIVKNFNCKVISTDSTDVEEIYKISKKAVTFVKINNQPVFLNLKYYRYLEHVGVNKDFDVGYRSKIEFGKWLKKDPIKLQKERLLKMNINNTQIEKLEEEIMNKIERSINLAKNSPFPESKETYRDVLY